MELGERVVVDEILTGTVRYVGCIDSTRDVYVGVELDVAIGNTDGKFEGIRYFKYGEERGVFRKRKEVVRHAEGEQNKTEIDDFSSEKYITCWSIEESDIGSICDPDANALGSCSTEERVSAFLDESISIQRKAEQFRKEAKEKGEELWKEKN